MALLTWLGVAGCSDEAVHDGKQAKAGAAGQSSADQPEAGASSAAAAGASSDADSGSEAGAPSGPVVGNGGKAGAGGTSGSGDGGSGALVGSFGGEPDMGPDPVHGTTSLGGPCDDASDCVPGLACLAAGSDALGDRSPPHGLCTKPCTDSGECTAFDAGGLCFPLAPESDQGYCVEGCTFGNAAGASKCHGRRDFACMPAYLAPSSQPCLSTDDCLAGDLCSDGICQVTLPACLPSCRGNVDCPSGTYCDQSFLSGTCTTQKPVGTKGLGEPCNLPSRGEPDECLGYCQSDGSGVTGFCSSTCGLLSGCSWNDAKQQFDGLCIYPSVLTAEIGGVDDFGFCAPTCDCSAECQDPSAAQCSDPGAALGDAFSGAGVCFTPDGVTPELDQCR